MDKTQAFLSQTKSTVSFQTNRMGILKTDQMKSGSAATNRTTKPPASRYDGAVLPT